MLKVSFITLLALSSFSASANYFSVDSQETQKVNIENISKGTGSKNSTQVTTISQSSSVAQGKLSEGETSAGIDTVRAEMERACKADGAKKSLGYRQYPCSVTSNSDNAVVDEVFIQKTWNKAGSYCALNVSSTRITGACTSLPSRDR